MLKELVEKNLVSFHKEFDNWEEAVRVSCEKLLENEIIDERYIEQVIDSVKKYGPYIVLAPKIAMPHSTQNAVGVHKTAIAFMRVEKPVHFEEGNPDRDAYIFFSLASVNPDEHLENMSKLANILMQPEVVDELCEATSAEDLIRIDEKYNLS